MTDTYAASSSPSAPPPAPRPNDEETRAAAPEQDAPENAVPPASPEAPQPSGGQVWSPPVPQFPARPSQAPPVQYTGPQPAPVPQYVPPQPPAPQQPQPQYMQQPQYAMQPQAAPQQGYAPPQMYAPPQQVYAPPPSPRMTKTRVGRRFMRRVVTGGSGIGKLFGGGRLPLTLLVLALVGVITWLAIDRSNLQSAVASAKPNAVAQGAIVLPPEAPVVTTYLSSFKNNDLEGAWNALNAKEKIRRIDNGEDKTVMKAVLDFIAKNSVSETYRFVGAYGTVAPNDFSKGGIYYYAVDIAAGSQTITRPMHFIVDDQGKVESVYDPLYRLVMANIGQ